MAPGVLGRSTAFRGMLASSSLFDGSADSSIMPLSASSEQAPTSQPPRELVERFEWPVVAKEIAHRLAAPNSILLNFTRTLKMSTHCSGIDTPVWAARVVERFSNVRFDVCSACECAPAAQKALTQVPGGHKHMFSNVLDMLPLAVRTEVDQVIKRSAPNDLYKKLSSIIMRTKLRECANCRASNHCVTFPLGCRREMVDLDVTGSSCTSYSPQGQRFFMIYFVTYILFTYRIYNLNT